MDDLEITDAKTTKPDSARPKKAKVEGMRTIMIPKTEKEVRDVYVSASFRTFLVKRGVPVQVPQDVVNALNNAMSTRYFRQEDPITGKAEMVPQEVHTVPFQTLD